MRQCRRYLFHEIAELDHLDETDVFVRADSYDQLAKENAELKALVHEMEPLVDCDMLRASGLEPEHDDDNCWKCRANAILRDYKKGSE